MAWGAQYDWGETQRMRAAMPGVIAKIENVRSTINELGVMRPSSMTARSGDLIVFESHPDTDLWLDAIAPLLTAAVLAGDVHLGAGRRRGCQKSSAMALSMVTGTLCMARMSRLPAAG